MKAPAPHGGVQGRQREAEPGLTQPLPSEIPIKPRLFLVMSSQKSSFGLEMPEGLVPVPCLSLKGSGRPFPCRAVGRRQLRMLSEGEGGGKAQTPSCEVPYSRPGTRIPPQHPLGSLGCAREGEELPKGRAKQEDSGLNPEHRIL